MALNSAMEAAGENYGPKSYLVADLACYTMDVPGQMRQCNNAMNHYGHNQLADQA